MSQPALEPSKPVASLLSYRFVLIAVWVLVLLLVTACSFTKTVTLTLGGIQSETDQAAHQVVIQNVNFIPHEIDIRIGDRITWVNEDKKIHSVTSWYQYQNADHVQYTEIGKVWDSGDINPGQSFSRTFNQAGTFEYVSLPLYFYFEYAQNPVGVIVVSE